MFPFLLTHAICLLSHFFYFKKVPWAAKIALGDALNICRKEIGSLGSIAYIL